MVNNLSNQYPQQYNPYQQQPEKNNDGMKKTAFVLGSWLGLNKLTDVFNHSCSNENYDKTIIGRMGTLGDKLSNKYGNTSWAKWISGKYTTLASKTKAFIDKSSILSPMFNTPTSPECPFVTGILQTQQHADLEEAARTLNTYMDELPKSLKEAGATKAEINAFKSTYGKGMFGGVKNEVRAIQEFQFDKLGKPKGYINTLRPEEIAKELKQAKLQYLGLTPDMLKEPHKFESEIIEACRRGGKNVKAFFGRDGLYKITSLITKRTTNAEMSYNKLASASKHTTKLGRAMAKLPKLLVRGLTFGGGKVNSLLVAFGLGTALFNATKAPKEQKVGTAVAGGVDAVSWILAMPLAVKLMHGVNGLKNIGRSEAEVKAHLDALKQFNADVDAGLLTNKFAYNRRLVELNKLKQPKTPLKGFQKVLSKIGSGLSVALELPNSYKEAVSGPMAKEGAMMRNIKRALPNFGKNCIGYPLRFALYMLVAQPLVDKVISKITSSIFGKPYEPEEENKEEIAQQQQMAQVDNNAQNYNQNFRGNVYPIQDLDYTRLPEGNLVREYFEHKANNQAHYVPNEVCGIPSTSSPYDTQHRTYIPSEAPVAQSFKSNDRDLVDGALIKADSALNNARACLNGRY